MKTKTKCLECNNTGKINEDGGEYDYCTDCPRGDRLYDLDTFGYTKMHTHDNCWCGAE